MALVGQAIMCSFNDVVPEGRENLYEWHNREHMAERVAIPGFLRGRRCIARRGAPEFLFLYEAESLAVLGGPDYLARLNDPTPWTRQSLKNFHNSFRSIFRVSLSLGIGIGGAVAALRFDAADPERLERALTREILPPIEPMVGITGVHLAIADPALSGIETVERAGRGAPFRPIPWLVLVEGVSEAALDRALDAHLDPARLEASGAKGPIETGIYQLEICRSK